MIGSVDVLASAVGVSVDVIGSSGSSVNRSAPSSSECSVRMGCCLGGTDSRRVAQIQLLPLSYLYSTLS